MLVPKCDRLCKACGTKSYVGYDKVHDKYLGCANPKCDWNSDLQEHLIQIQVHLMRQFLPHESESSLQASCMCVMSVFVKQSVSLGWWLGGGFESTLPNAL